MVADFYIVATSLLLFNVMSLTYSFAQQAQQAQQSQAIGANQLPPEVAVLMLLCVIVSFAMFVLCLRQDYELHAEPAEPAELPAELPESDEEWSDADEAGNEAGNEAGKKKD